MKSKWIWFIAKRYIFRKQKKSPSSALSITGIATGVFALIVIIAVMNGFQLSFIESILEISSYHIRIKSIPVESIEEARGILLSLPGIQAAVPFNEFQGLIRGRQGGQRPALIRGIPANISDIDSSFMQRFDFVDGYFNLNEENSVILGTEMARRLGGLWVGDSISIFSIPALFMDTETHSDADSQTFIISGIFRTGFYEYDDSLAFINIEHAAYFSQDDPSIGIKLRNRFNDRNSLYASIDALSVSNQFDEAIFSSWRDYNKSFFGALRTEKLFMFLLFGLIFIVVGLNIYQSQRRIVLEHREEIGLLRAIGAREKAVRLIFVFEGGIIGFTGAGIGLILGLIISTNISGFFTIIEYIVNFFIGIINIFAGVFGSDDIGGFSIFSPAVFYLKEIPTRIIPVEIILIFLFGFLSAIAAAWFASRKISIIRPAEVLRYE